MAKSKIDKAKEGGSNTPPAKSPSNNDDVAKLQQKIADLTGIAQHTQAEFENYKRRVERDRDQYKFQAKRDVLLRFLHIIDNYELAIKSFTGDKNAHYKGFELIYSQLLTLLEQEGVTPITQEQFDPNLHEPLLTEEGGEDGKILEVLQKGYLLDGKVLRAAKVKISKRAAAKPSADTPK